MATDIERRNKLLSNKSKAGLKRREYFLTIEERKVVDEFVKALVLKRTNTA